MSETVEPIAAPAPTPEPVNDDPAAELRAALESAYDEVAAEPDPEAPAERDAQGRFVARETADPAEPEAPTEEDKEPVAEVAPASPVAPPAPILAVLEKHRALYAARGLPPEQAMDGLFEAQRALETQPVEAIRVLARQYGVDLAQFAPQAPAQPAAPQTNDPVLSVLLQKMHALETHLTTQQQQAETAARGQIEGSIAAFAADPKHSHFPAVRLTMGALMTSGAANDMATAYEMACRAHPEIHQATMKAQADAKARADAAARSTAAAQAKAKAVSVRGSPPVNGIPTVPDSIADTLRAAYDGRLN